MKSQHNLWVTFVAYFIVLGANSVRRDIVLQWLAGRSH